MNYENATGIPIEHQNMLPETEKLRYDMEFRTQEILNGSMSKAEKEAALDALEAEQRQRFAEILELAMPGLKMESKE